MPEQIDSLEDLTGKVIGRAFELTFGIGLVFTDGSFFRAEAVGCGEDIPDIEWTWPPNSLDERVAFGVIPAADLERLEAERKTAMEVFHLARERAEYERLRAKFEPGPPP